MEGESKQLSSGLAAGQELALETTGAVEGGVLLARVHVPELNVSKCLQFPKDQLVWDVKQQCLASLPKVRRSKPDLNRALFVPPLFSLVLAALADDRCNVKECKYYIASALLRPAKRRDTLVF